MKTKRTSKIIIPIIIAGSIFGAGFVVGQNNPNEINQLVPAGKTQIVSASKPKNVDDSLFWEAWKMVDKNFINKVDSKTRSIGAELSIRDALLTVVAPLEGSPAEKAGIKPKDTIVKVDDKETAKMSFDDAIAKIRGKKGTAVVLTVVHDGQSEESKISVTRDTIEVKSVKLSFVGDNNSIALLKINQFGKDTSSLLKKFQSEIVDKKAKGIVIDLRNNPGGLLNTAIEVSSLFMPNDLSKFENDNLKNGVVVIEEDAKKEQEKFTRTSNQLFNLPFVVIQNRGSASASEIFAGAMKDYQLGKVIGETSFGKGSVQNLEELSNKGSVKITIAKWLTPTGIGINGKGINPDIIVKEEVKDNNDPALNEAISILNSNN
ncbi:MAG: Carboxyl-terminal protease [Berkelbacteria bacterium GW2011_GWA2_38_9]|uniref:Carboxyl-terminal protease n=1 Tax=Berkelbacteria bacterium GW2011_GWA2_38_9 TaxID=1618334 RepID=A0A0G0LPU2_9BACT|nr:MAG: Carboxyl-terminal protease [Berkelbacteria bacterium GW2011_GWA2_38_9]